MGTTAEELQEDLEQAGLMDLANKYRGGEKLDAMCNRFIKARRGDRKKSLKMLKEYLEWCEKVPACAPVRCTRASRAPAGSRLNTNTRRSLVCMCGARDQDGVLGIRGKTASQMLRGDTNPEGKALHDAIFPHGLLGRCKVCAHTYVAGAVVARMHDAHLLDGSHTHPYAYARSPFNPLLPSLPPLFSLFLSRSRDRDRSRALFHSMLTRHAHTGMQLGRPVLYQLYGTEFCAKKLEEKAGLSGKDLADYYTWMLERTLGLMGAFPPAHTQRAKDCSVD